jgi:N-acetylmuramoyl-L-alanine amidase
VSKIRPSNAVLPPPPAVRVAISPGHNVGAQGAVNVDGVPEFQWCGELARKVVDFLVSKGVDARLFTRPAMFYRDEMRAHTAAINTFRPALYLELHFNTSPGARAKGAMGLHWNNAEGDPGRVAASLLAGATAKATGIKSRGAHVQRRSWREGDTAETGPTGPALYALAWTEAPAVILETHFGDNALDNTAATEARDGGTLPEALADAIVTFLHVPGT